MNELLAIIMDDFFPTVICNGILNNKDKVAIESFVKKTEIKLQSFLQAIDSDFLKSKELFQYIHDNKLIKQLLSIACSIDNNEHAVLERMVENCIADITCEANLTDKVLLKAFFETILEEYKEFAFNNDVLRNKIAYATGEKTHKAIDDILKKLEMHGGQLRDIVELLMPQHSTLNSSEIMKIFSVLKKEMMIGNVEIVQTMQPLFHGKNSTLDAAIEICLKLLTENDVKYSSVEEKFRLIENEEIKNEVARYLILYFNDDEVVLTQIGNEIKNIDLKDICSDMSCSEWGNIVRVEQNKSQVLLLYRQDKYKAETWLLDRLIIIYTERCHINSLDVINILLGDGKSIVARIYFIQKQIEFWAAMGLKLDAESQNIAKGLYHELIVWRKEISYYSTNIQREYYIALFRCRWLLAIDGNLEDYRLLSLELKSNKELVKLKMFEEIEKDVDEPDNIMKECMQIDDYEMFVACLDKIQTPELVKEIIEKYIFVINQSVTAFLLYINVLIQVNESDKAKKLLEDYLEKYDNYLPYWTMRLKILEEDKLDEVFLKLEKPDFYEGNIYHNLDFIELLLLAQKYDKAETVINRLKNRGINNPRLDYYIAIVFYNTNRELDALERMKQIFSYYEKDEFAVSVLLQLSLKYNRVIADEWINAAMKIDSEKLLILVAEFYRQKRDYDKMENVLTRAILKSEHSEINVYLNYFNLITLRDETEVPEIEKMEENVVIYIDGTACLAVAKQAVLKEDNYLWNGIEMISLEKAIEKGLLRKRIGDTVTINQLTGKITQLEALPVFLTQFAIKKLIEAKQLKPYRFEQIGEEPMSLEEANRFIDWVKINGGSGEQFANHVNDYLDISKFPMSFHVLAKQVSAELSEVIEGFMEDSSIVLRDYESENSTQIEKYVLSLSSVVMLHKIGITVQQMGQLDIVLPESITNYLTCEWSEIVNRHNRDFVASMGVVGDRLVLNEKDDEEKIKKMQAAGRLKEAVIQLPVVNNTKEIASTELQQYDLKDLLGICDYDAISISMVEKRVIVVGEEYLGVLAKMPELSFSAIGVTDFISKLELTVDELLNCIEKMIKFKFRHFLNFEMVAKLEKMINEIEGEDIKEAIFSRWIDILSWACEHLEDSYAEVFNQQLMNVCKTKIKNGGIDDNQVWEMILHFISRYKFLQENPIKLEWITR